MKKLSKLNEVEINENNIPEDMDESSTLVYKESSKWKKLMRLLSIRLNAFTQQMPHFSL